MPQKEKQPPDKPSIRGYKCCARTEIKTVVCIICESVYHKTHLNKLNNIKYVGETLVICPEHNQENIISKIEESDLSELTRYLITQIKLKKTEELQKELLEEIANKTQDLHNKTTVIDLNAEHELLVTENSLLKTHNKELTEKNQLLRELLNKHKESVTSKASYAEVVTNYKPKAKRIPKIIIKTNSDKTSVKGNIEFNIKQQLIQEKSIQTKNVHVKNNQVIVSCLNSESRQLRGRTCHLGSARKKVPTRFGA